MFLVSEAVLSVSQLIARILFQDFIKALFGFINRDILDASVVADCRTISIRLIMVIFILSITHSHQEEFCSFSTLIAQAASQRYRVVIYEQRTCLTLYIETKQTRDERHLSYNILLFVC